jgi:2-C-methyl-D-erythritol 2,4-cyclodiphosphate synthase
MNLKIGQGIDFHKLENGLKLWLGGVNIPSDKGCVAHSDGDVLLHAICDSLLGAAGLRDIGYHFPDTDIKYKNIDSKILLRDTFSLIKQKGFSVNNLDCTICLEEPKISPYIEEMKKTISEIIETEPDNVAIKATTTEKLGFTGRGEGIVAFSIVLLT